MLYLTNVLSLHNFGKSKGFLFLSILKSNSEFIFNSCLHNMVCSEFEKELSSFVSLFFHFYCEICS